MMKILRTASLGSNFNSFYKKECMSINTGLDLKTRFVWEKKKRITLSAI